MAISWKRFQTARAEPALVRQWFRRPGMGVSIASGLVSGETDARGTVYGLEFLDVDAADVLEAFLEAANWQGLSLLLERLPYERTPKQGGHLGWLCAAIAGNLKLARRQVVLDAVETAPVLTLIETRGIGGQCVVAPTPPGVHPECPERGYVMVRGSWTDVPIITPEERYALLELARSFNTYVEPDGPASAVPTRVPHGVQYRPGDELNATATRAWWAALLTRHGWKRVHTRGDIEYWQRPGKDGPGASATLGACGPYFYIFSSNAWPLESEKGYLPFMAYTLLDHGGDYAHAAKALAAQGYGLQRHGHLRVARAIAPQQAIHTIQAAEVSL